MQTIIGLNFILFSLLLLLYYIRKDQKLFIIIFIAALIRILFAHFNFYILNINEGLLDAIRFEALGWILLEDTFIYNKEAISCECILDYRGNNYVVPKSLQVYELLNINLSSSYFISYMISFVYFIVGRSPLIIIHLSILSGILSVLFLHFILKNILKNNYSYIPILFFSLFPMHILYSSLILRESFAILFFLISIFLFFKWYNNKNIVFLLFSILLIFLSILFHEVFIGVIIIYFFVLIYILIQNIIFNHNLYLKLIFLIVLIFLLFFIFFNFFINANMGKLPVLADIFSIEFLYKVNVGRFSGSAQFPGFFMTENPINFIMLIPLRIIYFIFSPFFWDVQSIKHLVGVLDSIFYMIFSFYLIKNFKNYITYPEMKILLIILIPMIIFMSILTANFGTGIRHRLKILPIFLILCFTRYKNK